MRKRSSELIAYQILKICLDGARKTRVMYNANLNSSKVNMYLHQLIKNGMIVEMPKGSRVVYQTTAEGVEVKKRFERLKGEMDNLMSAAFAVTA